jgi:hypothetical protein
MVRVLPTDAITTNKFSECLPLMLDSLFQSKSAIANENPIIIPFDIGLSSSLPTSSPPTSRLSLTERALVPSILKDHLGIDLPTADSLANPSADEPDSPSESNELAMRHSFHPAIYSILFTQFSKPSIVPKLVLLRDERAQTIQNLLDEVSYRRAISPM